MDTKKKMTVRRLLSGALVLLGFTSCSNNEDGNGEITYAYGTPYTRFQVKGKVTSETDEPLKGIRVVVRTEWNNHPMLADTVYTDAQGEFKTQELGGSTIAEQKVYFDDVDGDANGGSFKSDSISLKEMKPEKLEEGSGWNKGTFEFSTETPVKLKKATPEADADADLLSDYMELDELMQVIYQDKEAEAGN